VDLAEHRWSDDQGPFSGEATGPNPTDRGKCGTKRSVLTEGRGIPIAIVVAGANRNDMKLLADTLEAVVIERPEPTAEAPQHLCADKGYDFAICREEAKAHGYVPHIRSRGEERQAKQEHPDYRPRRWVVEVCHAWLNRFRKLLIRFEKLEATHLALLQLACAYIAFKRARSC
jgi:putative transposase